MATLTGHTFAEWEFLIEAEQESPHYDLFPADVAKLFAEQSMAGFTAVLTRGRWQQQWGSELKGSIGEGSNRSNFSDRNSVRIVSKY